MIINHFSKGRFISVLLVYNNNDTVHCIFSVDAQGLHSKGPVLLRAFPEASSVLLKTERPSRKAPNTVEQNTSFLK